MRRVIIHNHVAGPRKVSASDAAMYNQAADVQRAWGHAKRIDPMRYSDGMKAIEVLPDTDQWNAAYDFSKDELSIQRKFLKKGYLDQVQTLLHEIGHRGQAKDPEAFKAFKDQGLDKLDHFLDMANKVHRDDYARNGISDISRSEEAFAESYARFALGLEMPMALRKFWEDRYSDRYGERGA